MQNVAVELCHALGRGLLEVSPGRFWPSGATILRLLGRRWLFPITIVAVAADLVQERLSRCRSASAHRTLSLWTLFSDSPQTTPGLSGVCCVFVQPTTRRPSSGSWPDSAPNTPWLLPPLSAALVSRRDLRFWCSWPGAGVAVCLIGCPLNCHHGTEAFDGSSCWGVCLHAAAAASVVEL